VSVKSVKELKEFVRRHFPEGSVDDDGFEITIRTGLTEDPVTKRLVSANEDSSHDDTDEAAEFGRFRAD